MGFLSPLLLALGAAAAVPLVLHLFQRQQGPRVTFPALRYLRRAEKENARRLRLRQILLLLLRVTAVLLLALAAARPFSRAGGAGHEPTAVVIVLDNSMSTGVVTGDRRILDDLKDRALAALAQASAEDRFWLIRAGSTGEPALPGDAAATAERVRETEPTAAAADLTAALEHAATLLRAGAEGRAMETLLLSDLQATAFRTTVPGAEDLRALVWIPTGDAPANAAIGALEVGGGLAPVAGEPSHVAVTVTGQVTDSAELRLVVSDRVVGAAVAAPDAVILVPLPPSPAGLLTGRVEMDPDALRADDRRWFAAPVVPPPGVALGSADEFLDNALEVLAEAGRIRRVPATGAEVLVAPGGDGLDGAARATIVTAPAAPLALPALNRRLAAAGIPWRYDAPTAGEARFAPGSADGTLQTLQRVRLTEVYGLRPEGNGAADSALLRLADGSPWAVRGRTARGATYILLGSALTAEATTVPTSAAMVPLLDRLISEWAAATPPSTLASPGDEVTLPEGTTTVVRPDGVAEDVGDATTYRLGSAAGIYEVHAGTERVAAFAVNPPAEESRLDRLRPGQLEDLLPGWSLETADDPAEWGRDIFHRRLGREIARPILIAALLILLAEALAAATGTTATRPRAPVDEPAAPLRPRRGLHRVG